MGVRVRGRIFLVVCSVGSTAMLARIRDRTRPPRSWWWPTYILDEQSATTSTENSEAIKQQRQELSVTIRRVMLTVVAYGCFCLFTLAAPDTSLLKDRIKVPLANVEINFLDFVYVGPIVLVGLLIYLHVFLESWRTIRSGPNETGSPYLFNMPGMVPRLLSSFLFYWLSPIVFAAFAYKAAPYTETVMLPLLALCSVVILLFLQLRRWSANNRRSLLYGFTWLLLLCLFVYVAFTLTVRLTRIDIKSSANNVAHAASELLEEIIIFAGIEVIKVAKVGSVMDVRGNVVAVRATGESISLHKDSPVFERDELVIGEESFARLVFLDGTEIRIRENTTLRLEQLNPDQRDVRRLKIPVWSRATNLPASRGLDLRGVELRTQDLGRRDLRKADLSKASLTGINLVGRDMTEANLEKASLQKATLNDTNLSSANLSYAKLRRTGLRNARLVGANLNGADLSNADLSGANLADVDFSGADVNNASFDGADLRGAILDTSENLTQGQLNAACGDDQTRLPSEMHIDPCPGFVPYQIQTPLKHAIIRG